MFAKKRTLFLYSFIFVMCKVVNDITLYLFLSCFFSYCLLIFNFIAFAAFSFFSSTTFA